MHGIRSASGGIPPLRSIGRALVTNIREGRSAEGASTITMQLARDVFKLDRAKKFKRKFEETLLAVELEKKFSKQQILTMYANLINLGHGPPKAEALGALTGRGRRCRAGCGS